MQKPKRLSKKIYIVTMVIAVAVVSVRFWADPLTLAYVGLSQPFVGPINLLDMKDMCAVGIIILMTLHMLGRR